MANSHILSAFWSISFGKIAYVLLLCLLIVLLAREVYSVLFDQTLYVGNFEYFADGKASPEQTKSFPAHILGQHQLLRSALIEENRRREKATKAPAGTNLHRGLPSSLPEVARWSSLLTDAEIKVQGFDIGKLLSLLRAWVTPPAEITGFVEKSGSVVRASVTYPQRQSSYPGLTDPFETGQLSGEGSAAFAIAASLVWTQAAEADEDFRKIPRDVFVTWALAWWDYRLLRGREALGQVWSDDDKIRWRQARTLVERLMPKAGSYPEIWSLHADIIEVIPRALQTDEKLRTEAERKDDSGVVQQDRKKYAEAAGIATAITAAKQVEAAQDSKQVAPLNMQLVSETVKKVYADTTNVYPGRPIWIRKVVATAGSGSPMTSSVTATAIVIDAGQKKLLLPDYALFDATDDATYEFSLSASGSVIATAKKSDLVPPPNSVPGSAPGVFNGFLLAPLKASVNASNVIATASTTLTTFGPVPAVDKSLKVATSRGVATARMVAQTSTFAIVEPRVTGAGDGGAPVLDEQGRLVAMAYAGSEKQDQFAALQWLFEQKKLQLAP